MVLLILVLVNFLNYIDRWLLASVIPSIQKELGFSNTTAGLVMSAFMLGYFLTSPVFGYLIDRVNRVKLMSGATFAWSFISLLTGLSQNAGQLILARVLVGVGEASTASAIQPLAIDLFPKEKRNTIIAILTAIIPVGAALGFILGGVFEHRIGWRHTFFVLSAPGLILSLCLLFIKEPKRGATDDKPVAKTQNTTFWMDVRNLFHNKPYLNAVFGYSAFTFTVGGFASWAPHYLVTIRNVPLSDADFGFGIITVITGTLGSLMGGWIAGRQRKRSQGADMGFAVICILAAIPFAFLAFTIKSPMVFYPAIALTEFLLFMSQPAVSVTILETVNPYLRGMAASLCIFTIHLLGDLISPPIVGFIADHKDLPTGILVLPFALFFAAYYYFRSYQGVKGTY